MVMCITTINQINLVTITSKTHTLPLKPGKRMEVIFRTAQNGYAKCTFEIMRVCTVRESKSILWFSSLMTLSNISS